MGTGPSQLVETPTRPFERKEQRRVCLTVPLKKKDKCKKTSTLLKLIARRDWQKVLIRMSLFPQEVTKTQRMEWYGVEWKLLPLHLACALQPPPTVVAKLLEHHVDTARVSMIRSKPHDYSDSVSLSKGKVKKHRRTFARFIGQRNEHSVALFGDDESEVSYAKQSPTKTLNTAPVQFTPTPPQQKRKRRGGKLASFTRSIGKKSKTARSLFQDESDGVYLLHRNLSFRSAFDLLADSPATMPSQETPFLNPDLDRARKYLVMEEDASLAPSIAVSSYSLDEGSPFSFEDSVTDNQDGDSKDDESVTSFQRYLQREGMCLQLNPSGGLCTLKLSNDINPAKDADPPKVLSCPKWLDIDDTVSVQAPQRDSKSVEQEATPNAAFVDLEQLLEKGDDFLPVYIACLYRASPEVIKHLLDAYPLGSQVSNASLGMLPIHVVSAAVSLPPPVAPPNQGPDANRFNLDQDWSMVSSDALKELLDVFPEGRVCASQHNGMTPFQYAQSSMEGGDEKISCVQLLTASFHPDQGTRPQNSVNSIHSMDSNQGPSDEFDSSSTQSDSRMEESCDPSTVDFVPSVIEYDDISGSHSFESELYSLAANGSECDKSTQLHLDIKGRNWDSCMHILREDPDQAKEWQYGVNVDTLEDPLIWKSLPIHDACALNAPPELVIALIDTYPDGLRNPDPYNGSLPLHTACRCRATRDETIVLLLNAYPESAKRHDLQGCLPLHVACKAQKSLFVIKALVETHPEAAWTRDNSGNLPADYAAQTRTPSNEKPGNPHSPSHETILSFLKALPAEFVSPKHKRESVNIIADAEGRSRIIGYSQQEARTAAYHVINGIRLSETEEI